MEYAQNSPEAYRRVFISPACATGNCQHGTRNYIQVRKLNSRQIITVLCAWFATLAIIIPTLALVSVHPTTVMDSDSPYYISTTDGIKCSHEYMKYLCTNTPYGICCLHHNTVNDTIESVCTAQSEANYQDLWCEKKRPQPETVQLSTTITEKDFVGIMREVTKRQHEIQANTDSNGDKDSAQQAKERRRAMLILLLWGCYGLGGLSAFYALWLIHVLPKVVHCLNCRGKEGVEAV